MSDKEKQFMEGYLIGIRYTDGSLFFENYAKRYKFQLQATDKAMVNYTRKCFRILFNRNLVLQKCKRKTSIGKIVWQISTYVNKIKNKFNIKNIKTKENKKGFISAFFDAEGSKSIDKRSHNKPSKTVRSLKVEFSGQKIWLMKFLSKALKEFGFKNSICCKNKNNKITKLYLLGNTFEKARFFQNFTPVIKRKYYFVRHTKTKISRR